MKVRQLVLDGVDTKVVEADLIRVRNTDDTFLCPLCGTPIYNIGGVYRCFIHGKFIRSLYLEDKENAVC